MPNFDPDSYEPVADRIPRFWADHPKGRMATKPLEITAEHVVFACELYREGESEPFATGFAAEVPGQGPVNRTSALENCETSAVGRALANAGYSAKAAPRPSREEMTKTQSGPPQRKKGPATLGPDHVPPDVQKARLEAQAALSKLELMPDEIRLGLQAVYGVDDVKGLDADAALKLAKALASDEKAQAFSKRALDAKAAAESWKEGEK